MRGIIYYIEDRNELENDNFLRLKNEIKFFFVYSIIVIIIELDKSIKY